MYTVYGAAWSGEGGRCDSELTTMEGRRGLQRLCSIRSNRMRGADGVTNWKTPDQVGPHTLMSRAKEMSRERIKPDKHNERYGSYVIDHTLPIEVVIQ